MLLQELVHDLDDDFLNMDAYLTNHEEDLWSTTGQTTQVGEDDEFLNTSALNGDDGEETDEEEIKVEPTSASVLAAMSVASASAVHATVKQESTPEHEEMEEEEEDGKEESEFYACPCSHEEEEEETVKHECKSEPVRTTGNGVEMLDDGAWLDLDGTGGVSAGSSDAAAMISPTLLRRFSMENKGTGLVDTDLLNGDDSLFLSAEEMMDYYNFTDADMAALVPSPTSISANTTTTNAMAMAAATMPLPSPTVFQPHHTSTNVFVSDQDIPDMVNLFSSMYSPSQTVRNQTQVPYPYPSQSTTTQSTTQQPPLSIMVPSSTQLYNTMFPFSTTGVPTPTVPNLPFEYYTPPTLGTNQVLDPNAIFMAAADAISPPTKNHTTIYQSHAHAAAAAVLQRHNQPSSHHHPHLSQNQNQTTQVQQAQHMQAVAVALANSQAVMNTMRKLNTTYGVPIAPLQRSILESQSKVNQVTQPSKPKLTSTSLPVNSTKVSKISITPDISDFKLVQIFHHFCDPVTKVISLQRFHQLLQHHQVRDDHSGSSSHHHAIAAAAAIAQAQGHAPSTANTPPSAETQALFEILDKKAQGFIDLEVFMNSFQICNRCTEAKRRAHSAICAAQGQSFVPTALERQLMEDVAPVIVRVVPTSFEGNKVKSCEHYQWTWCEGFEKSGNEKCKGTNRHDKCPKYLANCTLWKHKLPPKNRKSKIFENIESPSKKLRHFA